MANSALNGQQLVASAHAQMFARGQRLRHYCPGQHVEMGVTVCLRRSLGGGRVVEVGEGEVVVGVGKGSGS